jgi:hypothetical protein
MPTYLERYLAGEQEQVWRELQSLGEQVCDEPTFTDARAVAQETMRRVRANIETLIARLEALGYQFFDDPTRYEIADDEPPRLATSGADTPTKLEAFEREFGPLPISLRAFYEVVRAVNLDGEPPREGGEMVGPDDGKFLFVRYLRLAIQRGGFPGLGMETIDEPPITEEIRLQLVERLLPF